MKRLGYSSLRLAPRPLFYAEGFTSMSSLKHLLTQAVSCIIVMSMCASASVAGTKPLTWVDLMQFRQIEGPVLSKQGNWIAYSLRPDRGDGEVEVRGTDGGTVYRIELGSDPAISGDERWVAATIQPTLEQQLEAEDVENGDDGPKTGLALLDLSDGSEERIERVESFLFSEDGRFLAYKLFEEEEDEADEEDATAAEQAAVEPEPESEAEPSEGSETDEEEDKKELGTTLRLRQLATGEDVELPYVT
ncbi:MAG: hypothetical protein GWP16_01320, partial [Nitrospirae bacterium]|nr:hypothetical protein [Nitrospirota bacterium]